MQHLRASIEEMHCQKGQQNQWEMYNVLAEAVHASKFYKPRSLFSVRQSGQSEQGQQFSASWHSLVSGAELSITATSNSSMRTRQIFHVQLCYYASSWDYQYLRASYFNTGYHSQSSKSIPLTTRPSMNCMGAGHAIIAIGRTNRAKVDRRVIGTNIMLIDKRKIAR